MIPVAGAVLLTFHLRVVDALEQGRRTEALWLTAVVAVLAGVAAVVVGRGLKHRARHTPWRAVTAACAAAVAAMLAIPIDVPSPAYPHDLVLVVTGMRNPLSGRADVRVRVATDAAPDSPVQGVVLGDGWVNDGDGAHCCEPPTPGARLGWHGVVSGGLRLRFATSPHAGIVDVVWDGVSRRVDLYAPEGTRPSGTIDLPLAHQRHSGRAFALWAWCAAVHVALIALMVLATWLAVSDVRVPPSAGAEPAAGRAVTACEGALFALPCAVAWGIALAAFWPGLVDPDSADQWQQMLVGRYNDWHPAFHTLTKWLVTRVWLSPAAVACVQILALSGLAGRGLVLLRRLDVPRVALWVTCTFFALAPANLAMVNTLWKDTAYGIVMLALTTLVLDVATTRGARLEQRGGWAILGATAALVALYRHNGPPTAFATLLALVLACPAHRTRAAAALMFAVAIWVGVRGPLFHVLGVSGPGWVSLAPIVHQVAAHIDAGTEMNPADEAYLDAMRPLSDRWRYACSSINPTLFDGRFSPGSLERDPARFIGIWAQLTARNPGATLHHLACSSALVWRITQPASSTVEGPALWVFDDGTVLTFGQPIAGVEPASLLPRLKLPLAAAIMRTARDPSLSWLFWRPALYLYVALAGFAVLSIRRRDWRFLLAAMPVTIHSFTLLPVVMVEHFRFQYPVFLVGSLLGAPVLATAVRERAAAAKGRQEEGS